MADLIIPAVLQVWLAFLLIFALMGYPISFSILFSAVGGLAGGWAIGWWQFKEGPVKKMSPPSETENAGETKSTRAQAQLRLKLPVWGRKSARSRYLERLRQAEERRQQR